MKINTKIAVSILSILIMGGFGLGKVEKASADTWYCTCIGDGHPMNGTLALSKTCSDTQTACANACTQDCRSTGWHSGTTSQTPGTTDSSKNVTSIMVAAGASQSDMIPTAICPGFLKMTFTGSPVKSIVNCLLLIVLGFLGWILQLAGALFAWIVDPKNMSAVMDNPIIYQIWGQVRDVLNISFILVLLFSAFCTIFGIDKYSYKKILLTLVIMALLVNFSFPIARFIIDLSNVIMYYFINNLGFSNLSQTFPGIAKSSHLSDILNPSGGVNADTSFLLASVVFTFIFSVTLLVIAILFLIRVVVLTILIIFSSIAFVGSIVPFLSSQAGKWWDNLFKYAFFGPVMLFMLYIAIQMLGASANFGGSMKDIASKQSTGVGFVAAMTFFAIPIVILWIGIGFAQQMSIIGAGVARKVGFGAVGWATGVNFGKNTFKAYQARRKEASATSTSSRLGRLFGSKQDQLRSKIPIGKEADYAKLRYQQDQTKRVDEAAKLLDAKNASDVDLEKLSQSGDKFEKAAAIIELAAREKATGDQLDSVRGMFGADSQVARQLEAKIKTYDPAAVFADQMVNGQRTGFSAQAEESLKEFINSNQFDAKKLKKHSLENETLMAMGFNEGAISLDDLRDLNKKGEAYRNAIKSSLGAMMASGSFDDNTKEAHKNAQMAYFQQTGKIAHPDFIDHVSSNLSKDSAYNMDYGTVASLNLSKVKQGRIKDIAHNMKDNAAAKEFIRRLKNDPSHADFINDQPDLKNF
jgi:hypothetical protein